jgi:predicted nucleic acid-binding protein
LQLILDSDVFVDLIRNHPPAINWLTMQQDTPFLSGVAALEISFGARSAPDLAAVNAGIKGFTVLWPNGDDIRRATTEFSRLNLSQGIGPLDAVVAALALRHGLPLATYNVKHFRGIKGLTIVQPYQR